MIPAINEYITAYNALTETTDDDIPLLTDIVPTDQAQQAAENLQLLSDGLKSYFDTYRLKQEAADAEDNGYIDQIRELRSAWEENDGGTAFVDTIIWSLSRKRPPSSDAYSRTSLMGSPVWRQSAS